MSCCANLGSWPALWLLLCLTIVPTAALHRTIGDPNDSQIQAVVANCTLSTPDSGFGREKCPNLLRCVLENLPADITAGMQSGSNIASLVPTILVLVGAGPLDLVQLAFTSPLRALATCVFAISLPQGLFRQLSTRHPRLSDKMHKEPRIREWRFSVPPRSANRTQSWARTLRTAAIDAAVLALAAIMMWQNVRLGLQSMVTWRCEYGWLLLCWPLACVIWLIVALAGLSLLAAKVEVRYSLDAPGVKRSLRDLLTVSYILPEPLGEQDILLQRNDGADPREMGAATAVARGLPARPSFFTVRIIMKLDQAWSWYEAMIEVLAVGIYLYGTFVLTSSQFISGSEGIVYMTIMVLCLSAIRVLETF